MRLLTSIVLSLSVFFSSGAFVYAGCGECPIPMNCIAGVWQSSNLPAEYEVQTTKISANNYLVSIAVRRTKDKVIVARGSVHIKHPVQKLYVPLQSVFNDRHYVAKLTYDFDRANVNIDLGCKDCDRNSILE